MILSKLYYWNYEIRFQCFTKIPIYKLVSKLLRYWHVSAREVVLRYLLYTQSLTLMNTSYYAHCTYLHNPNALI